MKSFIITKYVVDSIALLLVNNYFVYDSDAKYSTLVLTGKFYSGFTTDRIKFSKTHCCIKTVQRFKFNSMSLAIRTDQSVNLDVLLIIPVK